MKRRLLPLIPAFLILIAGFFVLRYQRREIASLESTAPVRTTAAPGSMQPLPASSESKAASNTNTSPTATASSDARAAAFIDGLRGKARPLIEKTDSEAVHRNARFKADRIALLLKLSPVETDSLRSLLEKHTGAALIIAARGWVAENRGEADALKLDAAEAASRTAIVEHDAQDAIFRLSRIVDLTPEQKDRLYASFVRKAAAAPESEPAPSELSFSFSLKDIPVIEHPSTLARSLLTPEQLALFDASRAQEKKAAADATGEVMGQLMPAILTALEGATEK
jgi:hypothetical protein